MKTKKHIILFQKKRESLILLLVFLILIPFYSVFAGAMQSGTYKITKDSINLGGQSSSIGDSLLNDTLGEVATGKSNSENYYMHAGFWQMQISYIAISNPFDLNLTNIGGINGEGVEGTISWLVTTDNAAGYSMTIKSTTTPAFTSSEDSFADYVPAGADPDFNFSIASNTSAFGFSPEGVDVSARFKDNNLACNIGSGEVASRCWDGLSTSPKTAFQRTTANHPGGSTATVRFRAESGSAHIQTSGDYSAPIVVTAITL